MKNNIYILKIIYISSWKDIIVSRYYKKIKIKINKNNNKIKLISSRWKIISQLMILILNKIKLMSSRWKINSQLMILK